MNKTTIQKKCDTLERKYPKEMCNSSGSREEKNNYSYHRDELYKLTCVIANSVFAGLVHRNSARAWGKILKEAEHYPGEAGLAHFTQVFGKQPLTF